VLLLEAGGEDSNPWIHVPLGYGKHFTNPAVNWLYSSEPPPQPFRHADVQDEVDRFPTRRAVGDYQGPATVESYTVMHGAEGPEVALVTALTPAGQRVLANSRDADTMASFMAEEPIGRAAEVTADGTLAV